jgi:hypothetical protein
VPLSAHRKLATSMVEVFRIVEEVTFSSNELICHRMLCSSRKGKEEETFFFWINGAILLVNMVSQ